MTDEKVVEHKPKETGLSVYDKLKMDFRSDSQKAQNRIGQLDNMIPRLQEERQQLIGMLNVMQNVLQKDEEGSVDGDGSSNGG